MYDLPALEVPLPIARHGRLELAPRQEPARQAEVDDLRRPLLARKPCEPEVVPQLLEDVRRERECGRLSGRVRIAFRDDFPLMVRLPGSCPGVRVVQCD